MQSPGRAAPVYASGRLTPGLGPFRVALISFAGGGFFVGVTQIELRMMALRLYDFGPFRQFARLAGVGRLMFSLTGGWLVDSVAALVPHTSVPIPSFEFGSN
jgi:hypothetical protein